MKLLNSWALAASMALSLGGCVGERPVNVPSGAQAYAVIPPQSAGQRLGEYQIGPFDELNVVVFQEPDVSLSGVPVDASGNILMPLIGQVQAEGRTTRELSQEVAARLDKSYLVNPQVSVTVTRSVSQRVTVDGQVNKPGVYEIRGRTTLIQSVALAEGMTDVAKRSEIVVIRDMNGKRYAAKFNIEAIRGGTEPDPLLRGGDVVIVGTSRARSFYQDVLKTTPLLGAVFVAVAN